MGGISRRNVSLIVTTGTGDEKNFAVGPEMSGNEFDPWSANMLITRSLVVPLLFHRLFRKGGFDRVVLGLFASSILFEMGASMWPK